MAHRYCLSQQLSSPAPPGVTHVSISVAQSCQEDIRRLDRTQLKLPDSLKCITFEHPHVMFPDEEYVSDMRDWTQGISPGGVEVRFACDQPNRCQEGHNDHRASTWRCDKEGEM